MDPEETGELNENAVGFAIVDADLALALLTPQNGSTTRYTALKASSEFVGFVGTDIFKLEASNIVVELNIATRPGATVPLPVVNLAASFPGGLAGLFAVFDDEQGSHHLGRRDERCTYRKLRRRRHKHRSGAGRGAR